MSNSKELYEQVTALLDPRLNLLRLQGYQVIVQVNEQMKTPERGKLLLDTERLLRKEVKRQLEVLLEPKGDLSKLRERLRGVSLDGDRDEIFKQRFLEDKPLSNGDKGKDESE